MADTRRMFKHHLLQTPLNFLHTLPHELTLASLPAWPLSVNDTLSLSSPETGVILSSFPVSPAPLPWSQGHPLCL